MKYIQVYQYIDFTPQTTVTGELQTKLKKGQDYNSFKEKCRKKPFSDKTWLPQTESYSPFHNKVFFFKKKISYACFELQIRKFMKLLLAFYRWSKISSNLPFVKLTFLNRIFAPVQCHHHPPKWPLHSHRDILKNNEDQGSGI